MTWQPIETAPKDGTRILAAFGPETGYRVDIVTFMHSPFGRSYWFSHIMETVRGSRAMRRIQPTHWMPLPDPPGET